MPYQQRYVSGLVDVFHKTFCLPISKWSSASNQKKKSKVTRRWKNTNHPVGSVEYHRTSGFFGPHSDNTWTSNVISRRSKKKQKLIRFLILQSNIGTTTKWLRTGVIVG
ncbi:hypothetical protein NPIL_26851 [Nephila pilipes]|uniref:Uncharacterized protein n=1 Tax=Nephila pilipes TaxID=299642 RepID=A0A8X6QWL5_NEPPI|nr:hypothetical protein NPIL_26851 [Nephila pilipes]